MINDAISCSLFAEYEKWQQEIKHVVCLLFILNFTQRRIISKWHNGTMAPLHSLFPIACLSPQWPRAVGATTAKLHYDSGEHSSNLNTVEQKTPYSTLKKGLGQKYIKSLSQS